MTFTLILRSRSGTPSWIWGKGLEVTVAAVVFMVDGDRLADDDVAEVERAGDGGDHDREAEGGAVVGAGEVDAGPARSRGATRARGGGRGADLGFGGAAPGVGLGFCALGDAGDLRRQPRGHVHLDACEVLLRRLRGRA